MTIRLPLFVLAAFFLWFAVSRFTQRLYPNEPALAHLTLRLLYALCGLIFVIAVSGAFGALRTYLPAILFASLILALWLWGRGSVRRTASGTLLEGGSHFLQFVSEKPVWSVVAALATGPFIAAIVSAE